MAAGTKPILKSVIALLVIMALGVLGYEVFHWLTHVYASGARVQTELTKIAGRVDGTLAKSLVREGDTVKEGQLLASLVDDDVKLTIEALETDLKLEAANRERLAAERAAFESELLSKLATERENMRAIEVEQRSIQERLALARKDHARVRTLFKRDLTAESELAKEQDKVLVLEGQAAQAEAKFAVARRKWQQVGATRQRLAVYDERIKLTTINEAKIRTQIEGAKVALEFRHVRSPINGIVDRVYKFKGEYVEEGETILVVHDPRLFWFEAHVDEDQVRHLRVGQVVELDLESHPFKDFFGKVVQIGSATTDAMGIGGQRGGQFGRQVERVPVRISIDDPPDTLTPGMLADINVRIYD